MIGSVLKRILMSIAGYPVAVLVRLIAAAVIYAVLGSLPNAPAHRLADMGIIAGAGLVAG